MSENDEGLSDGVVMIISLGTYYNKVGRDDTKLNEEYRARKERGLVLPFEIICNKKHSFQMYYNTFTEYNEL